MKHTDFLWPVHVMGGGWWYGLYWIEIDGGTCAHNPIVWFKSALDALVYLNDSRT